MNQQEQAAFAQGFVEKCAQYGVDPELMFKEANKVELTKQLLKNFWGHLSGRTAAETAEQLAKATANATKKMPKGFVGPVAPTKKMLRLKDAVTNANNLRTVAQLGTGGVLGGVLGGGYLAHKMMGGGGSDANQGSPYAGPGWAPKDYYTQPEGLAGIYTHM
jgi:hypothetical protein